MITMKTKKYELKEGTKTVWNLIEESTKDIGKREHTNCVEAAPFFRRLGGSEYLERNYTCQGYLVTRIISKSPCRTLKTVREFDFK